MNEYMQMAYDAARQGMLSGKGGPFGAVIVKDGKVLAAACNNVLADHDPTAHAEISAIREACRQLDTYDLSGCELYATGEPCPMCLSAIIWANMDACYYANPAPAAETIGFRDEMIYRHIRGGEEAVKVVHLDDCGDCLSLYEEYRRLAGVMY